MIPKPCNDGAATTNQAGRQLCRRRTLVRHPRSAQRNSIIQRILRKASDNSYVTQKMTCRNFVCSGAIAAATLTASSDLLWSVKEALPADSASPIRLGLASYTFRNFTRAQLIIFMKQLRVFDLNPKDVKDHLPTDPEKEKVALADYAAAGIYFDKDEDADMRTKFDYCKRAGIRVIVAGDPTRTTLPRLEKFAKEYDMRIAIHDHGPEDKLWASPLDVLKAVKGM